MEAATQNIAFILQGKGGVGKSLIASLLAQYYKENTIPCDCYDTDPVNHTLSQYAALKVNHIELVKDSKIIEKNFDSLIIDIINNRNPAVVDNGSSSFIALSNYIIENDIVAMLTDESFRFYIHTVLTGGQAYVDTLNGLDSLARQMPSQAQLVVWINSFFGAFEKPFEKTQLYSKIKNRIHSIIELPPQSESFQSDIQNMLTLKLTFKEVETSDNFNIMEKRRLSIFKKSIFDQLSWNNEN